MTLRLRVQHWLRDNRALYADRDPETARIRAALLGQVMRLTPLMMLANVGCGLLVLWCFQASFSRGRLLWFAVLLVTAAMAMLAWWRDRHHQRDTASGRAMRRSTAHAAWLAGLWSVAPLLWFPAAQPGQQLLVATLVAGMLAAGAFVLSPLPRASLAWAVILTAASLGALRQTPDPTLAGVELLMCFYGPVLAIGAQSAARKHVAVLRAQAQAERQRRMLAILLDDFEQSADDALWQTDVAGRLSHASPRLAELLGGDLLTGAAQPLMAHLERCVVSGLPALREALDAGRPFRGLPLTVRLPDGALRHLSLQGKRVLDEHGRTQGWRGVMSDMTERLAAQARLQELAHRDSLTGLANRHTLRQSLADAVRSRQPVALLFLDLDQFKAVNDMLGHTAGDELLRAVAQRLLQCMRPGDLVARLGGDEFAVLMPRTDEDAEAAALAQRLIEALSRPVDLDARRLRIGASVGGVLSGAGEIGVDELLVRADMALYAAKAQGRGCYMPYTQALGDRSRRRGDIEDGLRQAVQRGEMSLYWQPKVDLRGWEVVGAEALLRWRHPVLGVVPPGEFVAVAEQIGLIAEIGHWVLLEACRAGVGALEGLVVSVNVSPHQLRDEHYVSHVRDVLRETGLPPARLELEITESIFMGDIDGVLERLRALRSLGVRVALDDFGTGYSSLAYLRCFPFDTLKIDRAFVSEILLRKDARAIVQTIATMAATLGMRTVCEGVESAEQLAAVRDLGCDEVQGYHISRPQPLAGFVDWWRASPQSIQAGLARRPVSPSLHP